MRSPTAYNQNRLALHHFSWIFVIMRVHRFPSEVGERFLIHRSLGYLMLAGGARLPVKDDLVNTEKNDANLNSERTTKSLMWICLSSRVIGFSR